MKIPFDVNKHSIKRYLFYSWLNICYFWWNIVFLGDKKYNLI